MIGCFRRASTPTVLTRCDSAAHFSSALPRQSLYGGTWNPHCRPAKEVSSHAALGAEPLSNATSTQDSGLECQPSLVSALLTLSEPDSTLQTSGTESFVARLENSPDLKLGGDPKLSKESVVKRGRGRPSELKLTMYLLSLLFALIIASSRLTALLTQLFHACREELVRRA